MNTLADRINDEADRINQVPSLDVMGEVLLGLRAHRTVFSRLVLKSSRAQRHGVGDGLLLYLAKSGACRVRLAGGDCVMVRANELLAIPRGGQHTLLEALPTTKTTREGGDHASVQLLRAHVHFEGRLPHPLLQALPGMLHLPSSSEAASAIATLVHLIEGELTGDDGEASVTADRLVDVLFHILLKHHLTEGVAAGGLFRALRDPRLVRALALMHRDLAEDWTLDALAQQAGASRATLARRFKQTLGLAPMDYLTLRRLERSCDLLRESHYSLDRVAQEVGYGSSQSYARAFRRRFGQSPGELRRRAATV